MSNENKFPLKNVIQPYNCAKPPNSKKKTAIFSQTNLGQLGTCYLGMFKSLG
jgi:hypothetical protein